MRARCASGGRTELPAGPEPPAVEDLCPLLLLQSRSTDGDRRFEETALNEVVPLKYYLLVLWSCTEVPQGYNKILLCL